MNITWIGCHSNNYGVGRYGNSIKYIILHWIVGTLESADATFQNPTRQASAHYGVGDNEIHQWVRELDTAWHAGNLMVNRQSIGIENEGGPDLPISEATYQTLAQLVKDIASRYQIPIDRQHIKGHREVSDKPTACPGTLDIDKVIKLVLEDNMTEEQKRILQFLEEQKANEGKVREAFGALKDLPAKDAEIQTLQARILTLENSLASMEDRLTALESELKANLDLVKSQQSEVLTAKKELGKKNEELEMMTQQKNQYKGWYEKALNKVAEKLSTKELLSIIINRLFKR